MNNSKQWWWVVAIVLVLAGVAFASIRTHSPNYQNNQDSSDNSNQTGTLQGHVTIGPNCPGPEVIGKPCPPKPEAYTSRQVIVYASDGKTVVAQKHLDANGDYIIVLNEGYYKVTVSPAGIAAEPLHAVTITGGQVTTLNFNIDTGIR